MHFREIIRFQIMDHFWYPAYNMTKQASKIVSILDQQTTEPEDETAKRKCKIVSIRVY